MRRGGHVGGGARWAVAGLVLLGALATSCRNVESTVEVHDDETATVSVLVVPGLRNVEELGGEQGFERLIRQFDDPENGISAKKVVEPGGMGMLVTVEAKALSELSRPYVLPSPPTPPGATLQLFDSFVVAHRNGTWRLDAVARPVTQLAVGLPVLSGRLEDARYDVNVRLPGKVEASNGTESDGGVTWSMYESPGTRQLTMRSADRGPVSPLLLVVGGAAALILLGLLFSARGKDAATATKIHKESKQFLRRRKESQGSWQDAAARTSLPSGAAAAAATSGAAPDVLYADDYEGDESNALPVPGAGWGPAPPVGTTTTGTVRPAPRPVEASGDGAAAMGPSTPVVALDRGSRLGVAKEDPADSAPATPPGWYADPEDPSRQRFWDGAGWTEHRG